MSPYFKTLNEIKIQTFPIYKFKKMLFRFFWVRGDTDRKVTLATKIAELQYNENIYTEHQVLENLK